MNIIEELFLNDNNISVIDPDIVSLFRLKVLNLDNNSIREVPEELMQLPKLAVLGLKGNPLTKQFEGLASVRPGGLHDALQ